jgi:hypothetical protein
MRRVATIVPGKKDNSTLPTRNIRAIPQSRRGRILAEKQGFRLVERGRNDIEKWGMELQISKFQNWTSARRAITFKTTILSCLHEKYDYQNGTEKRKATPAVRPQVNSRLLAPLRRSPNCKQNLVGA